MSAKTVGEILGGLIFLGIVAAPIFMIWMYFFAMKIDVDNDGEGDI